MFFHGVKVLGNVHVTIIQCDTILLKIISRIHHTNNVTNVLFYKYQVGTYTICWLYEL